MRIQLKFDVNHETIQGNHGPFLGEICPVGSGTTVTLFPLGVHPQCKEGIFVF